MASEKQDWAVGKMYDNKSIDILGELDKHGYRHVIAQVVPFVPEMVGMSHKSVASSIVRDHNSHKALVDALKLAISTMEILPHSYGLEVSPLPEMREALRIAEIEE